MPFSSAVNHIHADTTIFGSTQPCVFYRDPSTGKFIRLDLGTPNSGKLLGVSTGGLLELQTPATFSLADNSVTMAKIQDIPSGTFLGRTTAATGDPEILTISQVQTALGVTSVSGRTVGVSASNLVEVLGSGTIDPALIPAQRSHEFIQVANQAARLALTTTQVQPGDEAYQQDTQETYKLIGTPPSTAGNWILISDASIDGNQIVSGVIAPSRLGSGTPNTTNFLRGDGSWQTIQGKDPLSVVSASGALSHNSRVYVNGTGAQITLSLPTNFVQGSQIQVTNIGVNTGFRITQATGQQIFFGDGIATTAGTAGYIQVAAGDNISTPRSNRLSIMLENTLANTFLVTQTNAVIDYA